ncbi:MAG: ABC-ATPase domain-containing protein [Clostridium sp.]|nr:ABC-ATPase domain-containing protein [Acetatifactor muris]MCM1527622.1 ABC-ATPase domain-containing protein [Bacteroides sp.]MCM1563863.1 ABC-ATPase domain-containing protein [Clostridium sp.]
MKTSSELDRQLKAIDHRGYPAYKDLKGAYDFGDYIFSIDHVQGDPFAAPSRVSVQVPMAKAGFPKEYYNEKAKRITLQDHLTRLFGTAIRAGSFQAKGSGKSGLLAVSHCGQEVLERTACRVEERGVTVRFEIGFPANGRSVNAGELAKILFRILPDCIRKSLYYARIDREALRKAIELCEDQQAVREQLSELGLCAFIADGSVLPRQSGVSDKPLKDAVLFRSPESLRIVLQLPHRGAVSGMGIRRGITLLVGGGYHGKSTVLQAIQDGVYDHIGGDGRELVITDRGAVKLRAEDGRSITNVDISPFINHLPNGKDTTRFSTEDASGSTSQAAGLMEAVESGSRLLLIDEDTSATNFMIRDRLMQQVVSPGEEPITPFIERVNSLYDELGISTILVAGSSGSYFHVADVVIQMKEYVPYDITEAAKKAAEEFAVFETSRSAFPPYLTCRNPLPDRKLLSEDRLKIKTFGKDEVSIAKNTVELRGLEQLKDEEQTRALGYLLKELLTRGFDGKRSLAQAVELLEKELDEKGPEALFARGDVAASLAMPRKQEIMACVSRYRGLRFT